MPATPFEISGATEPDAGTTLVTAATGMRVKILALHIESQGGAEVFLEGGGRVKMRLSANAPLTWQHNPEGWFYTDVSEGLRLHSDAECFGVVTHCLVK